MASEVEIVVVCNVDFCLECGYCLACYGGDPCHNGGGHTWPNAEQMKENRQGDE